MFIAVEGSGGAGKTTFCNELEAALKAVGLEVVRTREPGGTPNAEALREIMLSRDLDPITHLLAMFAARNEHLKDVIRPALARGAIVLCDRFVVSSYAFQVYGGLYGSDSALDLYEKLLKAIVGDTQPTVTFLLDAPVDVLQKRIADRNSDGSVVDQFDDKEAAFFTRVRDGFLAAESLSPSSFLKIDTSVDVPAWNPVFDIEAEVLKKQEGNYLGINIAYGRVLGESAPDYECVVKY